MRCSTLAAQTATSASPSAPGYRHLNTCVPARLDKRGMCASGAHIVMMSYGLEDRSSVSVQSFKHNHKVAPTCRHCSGDHSTSDAPSAVSSTTVHLAVVLPASFLRHVYPSTGHYTSLLSLRQGPICKGGTCCIDLAALASVYGAQV